MPREQVDYLIGERGVQLVPSPIHTPDGGILAAQNVEFIRDAGIGGIGTRGGLSKLNSAALAGSILSLSNIPLAFPSEFDLMLGLNDGETNAWKKSTDGTSYSSIASATLQRASGTFVSLWGAATIPRDPRSASYKGRFYFPGSNYVVDTTAPLIVTFDGTTQYEVRIPNNPTSTGVSKWIADLLIWDGLIYVSLYDPSGAAPDHKGRVLSYNPSDGELMEIGNRFGNGSGENTKGFPFCLTNYLGLLWAGTYGISGNNRGGVYRIQPGVDETWTLDLTATLHNGYYMSLCAYKGKLYAATDADNLGTAIIQQRTSTGTWTTSLSAPAGNTAFFCSLIEFNSTLFAGYHNPNAVASTLIKAFDGTTWTTDKNVGVDIAALVPGKPFIYRSNLYWPFYDLASDGTTTGFLLKRTTAGVWSTVLSSTGIRGGVGLFTPAA